jgi:hypothetical protein
MQRRRGRRSRHGRPHTCRQLAQERTLRTLGAAVIINLTHECPRTQFRGFLRERNMSETPRYLSDVECWNLLESERRRVAPSQLRELFEEVRMATKTVTPKTTRKENVARILKELDRYDDHFVRALADRLGEQKSGPCTKRFETWQAAIGKLKRALKRRGAEYVLALAEQVQH